MRSEEVYAKALRMMELAKTTMNPSCRAAIMDDAFTLIRKAKQLRDKEPKPRRTAAKYRVMFQRTGSFLYFDLPMSSDYTSLLSGGVLAGCLRLARLKPAPVADDLFETVLPVVVRARAVFQDGGFPVFRRLDILPAIFVNRSKRVACLGAVGAAPAAGN